MEISFLNFIKIFLHIFHQNLSKNICRSKKRTCRNFRKICGNFWINFEYNRKNYRKLTVKDVKKNVFNSSKDTELKKNCRNFREIPGNYWMNFEYIRKNYTKLWVKNFFNSSKNMQNLKKKMQKFLNEFWIYSGKLCKIDSERMQKKILINKKIYRILKKLQKF